MCLCNCRPWWDFKISCCSIFFLHQDSSIFSGSARLPSFQSHFAWTGRVFLLTWCDFSCLSFHPFVCHRQNPSLPDQYLIFSSGFRASFVLQGRLGCIFETSEPHQQFLKMFFSGLPSSSELRWDFTLSFLLWRHKTTRNNVQLYRDFRVFTEV